MWVILSIRLIHSCWWWGSISSTADPAGLRNGAWTPGQNEAYSIPPFSSRPRVCSLGGSWKLHAAFKSRMWSANGSAALGERGYPGAGCAWALTSPVRLLSVEKRKYEYYLRVKASSLLPCESRTMGRSPHVTGNAENLEGRMEKNLHTQTVLMINCRIQSENCTEIRGQGEGCQQVLEGTGKAGCLGEGRTWAVSAIQMGRTDAPWFFFSE